MDVDTVVWDAVQDIYVYVYTREIHFFSYLLSFSFSFPIAFPLSFWGLGFSFKQYVFMPLHFTSLH